MKGFIKITVILMLMGAFLFSACGGGGSTGDDGQVNGQNVNLSTLAVSEGTLSPKFNPDDTSYNLEIPYANTLVVITPTLSDPEAKLEVNGTEIESGQSVSIPLTNTSTDIVIKVTAPDNTTSKSYSMTVFRAAISHNANLASLELTEGTLSPGFDANTISYTVSVPYATGEVNVSAVPAGIGAAISTKIGSIFNNSGTNTITITVTAQDGTTKKIYTVIVNRGAADFNSNLAGLTLSSGTLSPVFSESEISYTAQVENSVGSITVRPTASYNHATIKVNNNTVASGVSSNPVNLNVGINTITIEVTAEDGTAMKTYSVNVQRLSGTGHNADLASLSTSSGLLSPVFSVSTLDYSVSVYHNLTSIRVTPSVFGANSTVVVNNVAVVSGALSQEINLPATSTVIEVVVTAEDKTTKKYYSLTINKDQTSISIIANHLSVGAFSNIPVSYINAAKANLRIAYSHTSHGSQLISGMDVLMGSNSLYSFNTGGSGLGLCIVDIAMPGDLGNPDRVSWASSTRTYLDNHPDINVIVWSWGGQVDTATIADIQLYLNLMNQLEIDYPNVKFVYMTGYLVGSGITGNLYLRNEQIRNYCISNNKILFDFADIESYTPDGVTYYPNGSDAYECAISWIASNPNHEYVALSNQCIDCSHSHNMNCLIKARAVWWLWARLAGWNP